LISITTLEEAREGDREAFIIIYNHYRQKVYNTAYFILKDYQYADDVVQETFLQVHLKLRKLSNLQAFECWLYKIVVNLSLRLLKKAKRISTITFNDEIEVPELNETDNLDNLIVEQEMLSEMMNCIYALPDKHRIVITLFYFNNMSLRDISEVLECSEGTVKSRLFYGKKLLKSVFSKRYYKSDGDSEGGIVYEF
jgi:RNA polymerase sigma-70 factor (ECF subfamily)